MIFDLEQIDRAIEWAILDTLIDMNLHPNKRQYLIDDDETGYLAACQVMEDAGTFHQVFGVGGFQDREQLKARNIIIDRPRGISPGSINFAAVPTFVKYQNGEGQDVFRKDLNTDSTNDIEYEVRYVAYNAKEDRLIIKALSRAFGRRKFLKGIVDEDLNVTDDYFLISQLGDPVDLSERNNIERVFRYNVKDVILGEAVVLEESIAPMNEIHIGLNPEGSIDDDTEDVIIDLD